MTCDSSWMTSLLRRAARLTDARANRKSPARIATCRAGSHQSVQHRIAAHNHPQSSQHVSCLLNCWLAHQADSRNAAVLTLLPNAMLRAFRPRRVDAASMTSSCSKLATCMSSAICITTAWYVEAVQTLKACQLLHDLSDRCTVWFWSTVL
jgi:hypothetical protein